jgi:pantoate--beta-alanine ligase
MLRTPAEVRAATAAARAGRRTIGLVPTMGAFHAGHEALIRAGRESSDLLVVSLFVNPAQFEDPSDLAAYPRDEAEDAARAAALGADLLFAPPPERMYPPGFATTVSVAGLSDVLEGAVRGAGHFAGVCTVVAKLLNVVAPQVAWFGQKDAQQVAVLRRMVADLDLPVRIEVHPTVRDADGLALSSRNARLDAAARAQALALPRALAAAERAAADLAGTDPAPLLAAARAVLAEHGVEPEYLALVDPDELRPLPALEGPALLAVAARVGGVRLIDNVTIEATGGDPLLAGADHETRRT